MTDDWFDLLAALLDARSRFLVVGAHALAVHGVPRGTQDLDVWIDPDTANVERVWQALAEYGAPLARDPRILRLCRRRRDEATCARRVREIEALPDIPWPFARR